MHVFKSPACLQSVGFWMDAVTYVHCGSIHRSNLIPAMCKVSVERKGQIAFLYYVIAMVHMSSLKFVAIFPSLIFQCAMQIYLSLR